MYDKIRICLCHPRLIGLYYKDSFLKVIGYVLALFLCYALVAAGVSYGNDHFSYNDTKDITYLITANEANDISYDYEANTLSGTPCEYTAGSFTLSFLTGKSYAGVQGLIISFNSTGINVNYAGVSLGSSSYSDIASGDFSVKGIKEGKLSETIAFQDMLNIALEKANTKYATMYFAESMIMGVVYFAGVLIIGLLMSYFINPSISMRIRAKLCLYGSGVFYLFMIFSLLFGYGWIQYVALVLPIIYIHITFSHIIRVDKQ